MPQQVLRLGSVRHRWTRIQINHLFDRIPAHAAEVFDAAEHEALNFRTVVTGCLVVGAFEGTDGAIVRRGIQQPRRELAFSTEECTHLRLWSIRFAQLDPVRQPTSFAITALLKPPSFVEWLAIEAPLAYVRGRLGQSPGAAPSSHAGFEVGVDAIFFSTVTLGYRLWLPRGTGLRSIGYRVRPVGRSSWWEA